MGKPYTQHLYLYDVWILQLHKYLYSFLQSHPVTIKNSTTCIIIIYIWETEAQNSEMACIHSLQVLDFAPYTNFYHYKFSIFS